MAGTITFFLVLSILSPAAPYGTMWRGISKGWQNQLKQLAARKIQEHMWCQHLDQSQEERILWAEMDQAASRTVSCTNVKEDQELSLPRQLSHARRPSFTSSIFLCIIVLKL